MNEDVTEYVAEILIRLDAVVVMEMKHQGWVSVSSPGEIYRSGKDHVMCH